MTADGRNRFLMAGVNSDIISCWTKCYEQFKDQPKDIVDGLRGYNVDSTCQAIYQYMVERTYYKLDKNGEQLIKSPGRLIKDGCGDCKSYTMFIACCLHCLDIPCIVRFVNFNGRDQYTHVYPVAIDENGNEIIMDACELAEDNRTCLYNYARPYARKKDIYYG